MAVITITIDDAQFDRVVNAFSMAYNYSPTLGITKAQFAKRQVIAYVRSVVRAVEEQPAVQSAQSSVTAGVNQITIT